MNRDTLNLNHFDPLPMALGERTTRLPAEPVNLRAAFEAFERGDHQVDGTVTVKINSKRSSAGGVIEALVRGIAKGMGIPPYEAIAQPVPVKPEADMRYQMERLAVEHKQKFGVPATKRVILDVGGSHTLRSVSDHRIAAVSAQLRRDLYGPEEDDGEGDTPDIAARVKTARVKLDDYDTYGKIRRCFLENSEAIDVLCGPDCPSYRFVQALEHTVRETDLPVTLAMCHTLFLHQLRGGRDVPRVMRSFGITDTRELGNDQTLLKAFYASLAFV